MMKKLTLAFLSLLTLGQLALAMPVHAQNFDGNPLKGLEAASPNPNASAVNAATQLPQLIGRIIRTLLGLLGIIFLVLMVYAGFLWMTARGEDEHVTKAKDIIKQAIIGLIIVFLAYALTGFIINAVVSATNS